MKLLEDKIKELELMLSDVLLIAEFYKEKYPFDNSHEAQHDLLFFRAHKLLGSTWEDIIKGLELPPKEKDELIEKWAEKASKIPDLTQLKDWYERNQIVCLFEEFAVSEDESEALLKGLQPILKEVFNS